jgi:hypothetical protein
MQTISRNEEGEEPTSLGSPTIVGLLRHALTELHETRGSGAFPEDREFSIAITEIENAIMRVNRGFARKHNVLTEADVQADHR